MSEDKIYPTKENSIFILCEDVRQETNNKSSFLGVYLNNEIILLKRTETEREGESDEKQSVITSLSFFLCFRDGKGKFNAKFTLKSPTGDVITEEKPDKISEKSENGTMNFVFVFKPFIVKELGQYSIIVHLDDHEYKNIILIREQENE